MKVKEYVLDFINSIMYESNLKYAYGGSIVLYNDDIVSTFRDIDILMNSSDFDKLTKYFDNNSIKYEVDYHSSIADVELKFSILDVPISIMFNMKILKDGEFFHVDLNNYSISMSNKYDFYNVGLPVMRLEDWYEFYKMMGREDRVYLLKDYVC